MPGSQPTPAGPAPTLAPGMPGLQPTPGKPGSQPTPAGQATTPAPGTPGQTQHPPVQHRLQPQVCPDLDQASRSSTNPAPGMPGSQRTWTTGSTPAQELRKDTTARRPTHRSETFKTWYDTRCCHRNQLTT
ncbi:hypothetical protein AVEN_40615-1 [Araneus ventricosus]|uniref:Uncharacterized protein n=1 Tax=Araneus ventricosus TaxID=182803 RepID=A0A4Y2JBX4_ARAVE|nr:hypothetical protein AVEN_40615-1 [Araneus ventricosus]